MKQTLKTMLLASLPTLLIAAAILSYYHFRSAYPGRIEQIQISQSARPIDVYTDYVLNLENRVLWSYGPYGLYTANHNNVRSETLYQFTPEEIERLVAVLDRCRLDGWGDSVVGANLEPGGHKWVVYVRYKNGSTKCFTGNQAYPETWQLLAEVLYEMTGIDVMWTAEAA